mmetsp:Transcript_19062/g.56506  ORF Transcript_19062/g.56506 Transcript_19062/m.56506 type:complete len:302 (-) Transcript_19062:24-929(-)
MPIYAKLKGKVLYADNEADENLPPLDIDVARTTVFVGRAGAYDPAEEPAFLGTCHSKSVSRRHATISWEAGDDGGWRLYCDSKNGVVVDGAFWCKGETVPLKNRSAIKFGPCACYFVLPDPSEAYAMPPSEVVAAPPPPPPVPPPGPGGRETKKPGKLTYVELIARAFASPEISVRTDGVSSREVCDWILAHMPDWTTATAEQKKLLGTGVQGALYRSKDYQKAPNASSRQNRWLRAVAASTGPTTVHVEGVPAGVPVVGLAPGAPLPPGYVLARVQLPDGSVGLAPVPQGSVPAAPPGAG